MLISAIARGVEKAPGLTGWQITGWDENTQMDVLCRIDDPAQGP